jgi:hypothetical protein
MVVLLSDEFSRAEKELVHNGRTVFSPTLDLPCP